MNRNRHRAVGKKAAGALMLALTTLPTAKAQDMTNEGTAMELSRSESRAPAPGSAEWFTGSVTVTPLFDPNERSQVGAALVRFEAGARTAWHTHPVGQRLVVVQGTGWIQVEGRPRETIRTGDVIWFPPDTRHWHGATDGTAMEHIAIQEAQDGSPVTWMEHVTDEQYAAQPD